jgi:hypothetical protein
MNWCGIGVRTVQILRVASGNTLYFASPGEIFEASGFPRDASPGPCENVRSKGDGVPGPRLSMIHHSKGKRAAHRHGQGRVRLVSHRTIR